MADLTVRVIETFPEFLLLEEKWDALVETMEFPFPTLTHAWIRCWWENLTQRESVYIITVWEQENLVAVLPMKKQAACFLKIFNFSCLHSIASAQFSLSNVICRISDLDNALASIRDHLIANSQSWHVLVLACVPLHAKTVEGVERSFCHLNIRVFIEPVGGTADSYFIDIKGEFDDFLNGLNKNFSHSRRNVNNRLARKGRVDLEVLKSYDLAALKCFLDLEHGGWKGDAGTSIQSSPETRDFYDRIAAEFSKKGQFLLTILRVNGEAVASGYGLVFHNTFYFLKIGVNSSHPEYKKIGPGQVLIFHLIKYCFMEKISGFDFYGPCYPYEAHWTKNVHQKKTVIIFNIRHPLVRVCAFLKGIVNIIVRLASSFDNLRTKLAHHVVKSRILRPWLI